MYKGSRRRLSIARGDMRFGLRFGPHCVCCAVRWANRVRNAVVEISQNGVYFRRVAPLAQRLEQRPFKSWVVGSNPTGGTAKPLETLASKGFSIPAIFWLQTQLVALTLFAPQIRIVTSSSAPVNTLPSPSSDSSPLQARRLAGMAPCRFQKASANTAAIGKWEIEKRLQFQRTRPSLLKKSLGGSYHSSSEFL